MKDNDYKLISLYFPILEEAAIEIFLHKLLFTKFIRSVLVAIVVWKIFMKNLNGKRNTCCDLWNFNHAKEYYCFILYSHNNLFGQKNYTEKT